MLKLSKLINLYENFPASSDQLIASITKHRQQGNFDIVVREFYDHVQNNSREHLQTRDYFHGIYVTDYSTELKALNSFLNQELDHRTFLTKLLDASKTVAQLVANGAMSVAEFAYHNPLKFALLFLKLSAKRVHAANGPIDVIQNQLALTCTNTVVKPASSYALLQELFEPPKVLKAPEIVPLECNAVNAWKKAVELAIEKDQMIGWDGHLNQASYAWALDHYEKYGCGDDEHPKGLRL